MPPSHCCVPQIFLTLERSAIRSLLWMCCCKSTQVSMRKRLVLKACIAKYRTQHENWLLSVVWKLSFYSSHCQCDFWRTSHVIVGVWGLGFCQLLVFQFGCFCSPHRISNLSPHRLFLFLLAVVTWGDLSFLTFLALLENTGLYVFYH